jgi:hypothetical protein
MKVAPILLGPLESLKTETDSISEMFFFFFFFEKTLDDGQSQKTWFFQVQYTIVKTLLSCFKYLRKKKHFVLTLSMIQLFSCQISQLYL